MARKAEAVHSEEIVDSEEDEEVLRLLLDLSKRFDQQGCLAPVVGACMNADHAVSTTPSIGHIAHTCQMKEQHIPPAHTPATNVRDWGGSSSDFTCGRMPHHHKLCLHNEASCHVYSECAAANL